MKKVFLFFAVAAVFAACAPKQAEQTEQTVTDSVATEVVDSVAAPADSAATAVVDSAAVVK